MDRFSEQLIKKEATGRDMFLRGLMIAAAMFLIIALVFAFVYIGIVAVAAAAAVIWGLVWLLQGTSVEYEYIVTNDDLDIDKIVGKRKRKRLVTISLKTVTEIGEYRSDESLDSEVAVMAHDETGSDMWYLYADTAKYGKLALVFNPDGNTLCNMIGGFAPSVKNKYKELYEKVKPAEDTENDSESGETDTPEE